MGHMFSKNQRTLNFQKSDRTAIETKRATSIIIKIRMHKMESKQFNNSNQSYKRCYCNANNQSVECFNLQPHNKNTHNQYVLPDNHQSKANQEIEHLEDRINQINNDNSTAFIARRKNYANRSTNSIHNNIMNDNEISTNSSDLKDEMSSNCDNISKGEADVIMKLQNISISNYKITNKPRTGNTLNVPSDDNKNQKQCFCNDESNTKSRTLSSASIFSNDINDIIVTPSISKRPDYVPMAPINPSDKMSNELNIINKNETSNFHNRRMILLDEFGATAHGIDGEQQMYDKSIFDGNYPKEKGHKSLIANLSKKLNCTNIPKSSSHQTQQQLSELKHKIVEISVFTTKLQPVARIGEIDFPLEDCDAIAREKRALEILEGIEPPPGHRSLLISPVNGSSKVSMEFPNLSFEEKKANSNESILNTLDGSPKSQLDEIDAQPRIVHSQVDFIHCLVPDLRKITNCSFYWGKMDRYEAERLLEGKPEGTFLLRDSAQEEFLFSVSFRKYGRSLHARIEQFNHKFSFDCHDPGVFTSSTVTGLLEHYKDPACVMFFEPALTAPLNRINSFSLQQLSRSLIVSHLKYDDICALTLPTTLQSYLKEYHYKQRVRVKRYDQ